MLELKTNDLSATNNTGLDEMKVFAGAADGIEPPPRRRLDIYALMQENAGRNYELHEAHINPAHCKTLRTIGFDRCYTRAKGAYLWDNQGTKYLDMLAGYGVFAVGRSIGRINHLFVCSQGAASPDRRWRLTSAGRFR